MKMNVVLCMIFAVMVTACGGGSADDDDTNLDFPVDPTDPVDSNNRPITTAFNGFMLSEVRILNDGRVDSARFYRYDSDQREISLFTATCLLYTSPSPRDRG